MRPVTCQKKPTLLQAASRSVEQTHQLLESLGSTVGQLKEAETNQRGYLITGKTYYLDPYNDALQVIKQKRFQILFENDSSGSL